MSFLEHAQFFDSLVISSNLDVKECISVLSRDLKAIDIGSVLNDVEEIGAVEEQKILSIASDLCRDKSQSHPEWSLLSGRLKTLALRRSCPSTFSDASVKLESALGKEYSMYCKKNGNVLNKMIDSRRDWKFDIFAIETLLKSYLAKVKSQNFSLIPIETPQYLYMRIAVYLWMNMPNEFDRIRETYDDLSLGRISHASPTQFNAGMKVPQLSSCYLIDVDDDTRALCKSWGDVGLISKASGGIGIGIEKIRHSEISNTGWAKGVVPWIQTYEKILTTIDQGGKRKGGATVYINDTHLDIFDFLELKLNGGKDEFRARDLFYGVMIHDEFMRRVENDDMWTLVCPAKDGDLNSKWGVEFEVAYRNLEHKIQEQPSMWALVSRRVKARDLWIAILKTQLEVSLPFILYKDTINRKSNHKNLGTITMSNLCTEITQYTDNSNIASCNLASIPVCAFVNMRTDPPSFDYDAFGTVVRRSLRNLEQVLNRNYYNPNIPEIYNSVVETRSIGIGLQGLADAIAMMDLIWESPQTLEFNKKLAEVMYYHGIDENIKLAEEYGPYKAFEGSPASKGITQFDMWLQEEVEKEISQHKEEFTSKDVEELAKKFQVESQFDWNDIRQRMKKHGLRFSLMFSQMPTASSAQILGNNESVECWTGLIYTRKVLSGCFLVVNKHLVRDLEQINMWNTHVLRHIISHKGSIQAYDEETISDKAKRARFRYIKRKYKTSYEISEKTFIDLTAARGRYVCQSESRNAWMIEPSPTQLGAMHFYAWKKGLKTGMYYLRQTARYDPLNFSLEAVKASEGRNAIDETECIFCSA